MRVLGRNFCFRTMMNKEREWPIFVNISLCTINPKELFTSQLEDRTLAWLCTEAFDSSMLKATTDI